MESIYSVAHGFRRSVEVNANGSTSLSISLPEGVDLDNLDGVHVMASDGSDKYFANQDTFNFGIRDGNVEISMSSFLRYADFRCTFYYNPSE